MKLDREGARLCPLDPPMVTMCCYLCIRTRKILQKEILDCNFNTARLTNNISNSKTRKSYFWILIELKLCCVNLC